MEFHRRWYGPDNAVLVLAGDVTAVRVHAELARRHYGAIARRDIAPRDTGRGTGAGRAETAGHAQSRRSASRPGSDATSLRGTRPGLMTRTHSKSSPSSSAAVPPAGCTAPSSSNRNWLSLQAAGTAGTHWDRPPSGSTPVRRQESDSTSSRRPSMPRSTGCSPRGVTAEGTRRRGPAPAQVRDPGKRYRCRPGPDHRHRAGHRKEPRGEIRSWPQTGGGGDSGRPSPGRGFGVPARAIGDRRTAPFTVMKRRGLPRLAVPCGAGDAGMARGRPWRSTSPR